MWHMITITHAIQGFRSAGMKGRDRTVKRTSRYLCKGGLGFRVERLKKEDNRVQKRRVKQKKGKNEIIMK